MSRDTATRNESLGPQRALAEAYGGLVPNLFVAQKELPRAVEAEQSLIDAIVLHEGRLTRRQKEWLLRTVSSVRRNDYCQALYSQVAPDESAKGAALHDFALRLAGYGPWFSRHDVETLVAAGFDEPAVLEAVLTIALGQLLCTLADGLRPELDPGLASPIPDEPPLPPEPQERTETPGPYLPPGPRPAADFQPYAALREQFGFVPNVFQAQVLLPQVLEAEIQALEFLLIPEDHLSRVQKENILLVLAAANANTYGVALHTQVLSALGVPPEVSDQVIADHHQAALSPAEVALLDELRKLTCSRAGSPVGFEPGPLRAQGLTGPQLVEGVAVAALANFFTTLQAGLRPAPDFPPRRIFTPKDLYPFSGPSRPTSVAIPLDDPDAELVRRVQGGETDAFEELVRRHSRRVFGTLAGLVRNKDDARDATQDVFLKAFEHINRFQGRSKFSTWLTSIAINTGIELLRQRKPSESLDEDEGEEGFRPRQVQGWADDPEQLLSASQRSELVREGVLRLPQKYRVAVLLRDINQLSTEEAAAALGLSIPALKARLLRGRLMLRESLAPHFVRPERKGPDA